MIKNIEVALAEPIPRSATAQKLINSALRNSNLHKQNLLNQITAEPISGYVLVTLKSGEVVQAQTILTLDEARWLYAQIGLAIDDIQGECGKGDFARYAKEYNEEMMLERNNGE